MLRHIFLLSIRAMARAFFCSKVTGAPPFHDVNVTQLIVIDYYYHAVVMLSCISTLTKVQKKGKQADEQENIILIICGGDGDGGYMLYMSWIMILNTDYCSGVFLSAEWF
mgnify:CR=1 FL=1